MIIVFFQNKSTIIFPSSQGGNIQACKLSRKRVHVPMCQRSNVLTFQRYNLPTF